MMELEKGKWELTHRDIREPGERKINPEARAIDDYAVAEDRAGPSLWIP